MLAFFQHMDGIKFSIVITTLNAGKTLKAAIESVLSQTYSNWELIVIDGGSIDNTIEIVRSYEEKIAYWTSEKDNGIYSAWNKGLRASSGDYICFLGADDVYTSDALETYAECVAGGKAEFVCSRVRLRYRNGKVREVGKPWEWSRFRRYMCTYHVGAPHNRRLFSRLGKFDESYKIAGDYEFFLRAKQTLQASYIPKVLCEQGTEGVSSTNVKVLFETYRAKTYHHSVSKIVCLKDLCTDLLRYYVRKAILAFPRI